MADAEALSKSAKRRAAKKARDANAPEEVEPPAPPAPEPKAKAKGKAKAEPKAEPKAAPKAKAEPKAEPKAKGKAKAEPKSAPAPAPAPEPKAKAKAEPKAEPKAAASKPKAKGKSKAAPAPPPDVEEEAPKKAKNEEMINYIIDDGTGGDWAVSTGLSKKKEKDAQKKDDLRKMMAQVAAAGGIVGAKNSVPGMAPTDLRALAGSKAVGNQAVSADVQRILAMKSGEAVVEAPVVNASSVTITVPEQRIGVVIGPKGATIKLIQEKTKVKGIDTAGNIFTVTGSVPAVAEAEAAINELIQKGFCSLQYDDFSENFVSVHPSYFPDLIGKGGCVIQAIKKELKVEVNMPPVPKGSPASKKFKVTLAGSAKQVEEAKTVINSLMTYGHHEVTHPGQVHDEIEVDNWSLRYIIGKGGSEMKHIQKNWDVRLGIPREHSVNQNVLIIGELKNVERAKTYIEKVMWNAANQAKGRDKQDGATDDWGDDAEEDWMRPYLFKR